MEEEKEKGGINLDWEVLLPSDEAAPPPELVVKPKKKRKIIEGDEELEERFRGEKDRDLVLRLERLKRSLETLPLKDGGDKCHISIERHQAELDRRRRLQNTQKEDEKCEKPGQFQYTSCSGKLDDTQKDIPVQENNGSVFCRHFLSKMEPNARNQSKTTLNNCDNQKMKSNGHCSSSGRHKLDSASRQTPFRCPTTLSTSSDNDIVIKDDKAASPSSVYQSKEELAESSKMKNSTQVRPSRDRRRHDPVVLVVEDESEIAEADQQIVGVDDCKKDARIYYPSRDDAKSVEICYSDLDCLASEAYLTSTIINFYIRYLQQHIYSKMKEGEDYHFFNTYFYEVLRKFSLKNDMEASFTKLRRWWKGVKLFEKAYIFLPIHDKYHWSLVIICIPDKEDGTGPSVLHLDSLGLHSSKLIFENIKRFLVGEWQFLKDEALSDPPFPDKIWDHFPRRINVKALEVPQQSNEYDCGLFVLSFIEQFILKAPRRMQKEDLAVLGKKWFNPVKASLLREKIHHLLEDEFNKEKEENCLLGA